MTAPHPARHGLVPLADRVVWSALLRLGLLAAVGAAWFGGAGGTPPTGGAVAGALTAGYAVAVLLTVLTPRVNRGTTIAALNLCLVLDGLVLGGAVHLAGGVTGLVVAVYVLHVSAVSLLMTYRTGVKTALWHSIVVLVLLHAATSTVLRPSPLNGEPFPTRAYLGFLALVWVAALGTSAFAALNERELRRRRYDAEMLHRFAVALARADDATDVAALLARTAVDELLARRAAVVVTPGPSSGTHHVPHVDVLHPPGPGAAAAMTDRPDPAGSLLDRAHVGEPALATTVDATDGRWVAERFAGARGLVVLRLPLPDGARGWLVLELGVRRRRGVDRRLLSTASQAVAHTALAMSRAGLVAALRAVAQTDGLTGLANRRTFDHALDESLARAARDGRAVAVALVDLDHFKRINDHLGHQVGDDVLRAAAHALRQATRSGDLAARYGGEEFAVVVHGDDDAAAAVGERLRGAVAAAASPVPVTCSVGVARWDGVEDVAQLLRRVDVALYQAKAEGRDRAVVSPTPAGRAARTPVTGGTEPGLAPVP